MHTIYVKTYFPKKRSMALTAIVLAALALSYSIPITSSFANTSADVTLGTATAYSLVSGGAITLGATTSFTGEAPLKAGVSPVSTDAATISAFTTAGITTFENNTSAASTARVDVITARDLINSLATTTTAAELGGRTFTPGVYEAPAGAALTIVTPLVLDGGGNSNSIFIFRTPAALAITAGLTISYINGAQPANIYWVVGAATSIGASTIIPGNFITGAAFTLGASSQIYGSVLGLSEVTIGASALIVHNAVQLQPTPTPSANAACTNNVDLGASTAYAVFAGAALTIGASNTFTPANSHTYGELTLPTPAWSDANAAYNDILSRTPDTTSDAFDIPFNTTFTPGVHRFTSYLSASNSLTLDGGGDPNSVFIFKIGGYFTTAAGFTLNLTNGAQPSNVFFQVTTYTTLGAGNNFKGTIIAHEAITTGADLILNGRIIALYAAITTGAGNNFTGSVRTNTTPGVPTIGLVTATAGTTATVAFTAPVSNCGPPITFYTATSSPEGGTGTLSQVGSGTISVTGLEPGVDYTFTVTATNSVGTSSSSTASNSITTTQPTATSSQLPSVLLVDPQSTSLYLPTTLNTAGARNLLFCLNESDSSGNNLGSPTIYFDIAAHGSATTQGSGSSTISGDRTSAAYIYGNSANVITTLNSVSGTQIYLASTNFNSSTGASKYIRVRAISIAASSGVGSKSCASTPYFSQVIEIRPLGLTRTIIKGTVTLRP